MSKSMDANTTLDPVVIKPVGFYVKAAWGECHKSVEDQGGLTHEDGEVNWGAAFSADPGLCSCPNCNQSYWQWGDVIRCSVVMNEYRDCIDLFLSHPSFAVVPEACEVPRLNNAFHFKVLTLVKDGEVKLGEMESDDAS